MIRYIDTRRSYTKKLKKTSVVHEKKKVQGWVGVEGISGCESWKTEGYM